MPGDHSERVAEEHAEYLEWSNFALEFEFQRVEGVRRTERGGWKVGFEAADWRDGMGGSSGDEDESTRSAGYSGSSSESGSELETDRGVKGDLLARLVMEMGVSGRAKNRLTVVRLVVREKLRTIVKAGRPAVMSPRPRSALKSCVQSANVSLVIRKSQQRALENGTRKRMQNPHLKNARADVSSTARLLKMIGKAQWLLIKNGQLRITMKNAGRPTATIQMTRRRILTRALL